MNREELDLAERKQRAFRLAQEIIQHADNMKALATSLLEEVSDGERSDEQQDDEGIPG